jgi:hypothetical protein
LIEGSKPDWFRPARGVSGHVFERKPPRAYAHGRMVQVEGLASSPILVARGLSSREGEYDDARRYEKRWGELAVPAWVSWVESMGPQVQVHLAAKFPLSRRQNMGLVGHLQDLYADACGERPLAVCAFQSNDRGGEHSHDLLCGSERLREVNRKLAFQLVREVSSHMIGMDQRQDERNELRALIAPVTSRGEKRSQELTRYVVRYVLREDVDQALELLR